MDGRRPAFTRVHRTRPTGRLAPSEALAWANVQARASGLHIGLLKRRHPPDPWQASVTFLLLESRSALGGGLCAPVLMVALPA
jgi:hypothetical protein